MLVCISKICYTGSWHHVSTYYLSLYSNLLSPTCSNSLSQRWYASLPSTDWIIQGGTPYLHSGSGQLTGGEVELIIHLYKIYIAYALLQKSLMQYSSHYSALCSGLKPNTKSVWATGWICYYDIYSGRCTSGRQMQMQNITRYISFQYQ